MAIELRRFRSVSVLRGGAVPGGGVLTARGRGEVFAAVVVEYFPCRVVRKGTRGKRRQIKLISKYVPV